MRETAPPLRVLHFPDWRAGNPYQLLLASQQALRGVVPTFASYAGGLFPLLRNSRRHAADVLHVHWLGGIQGAHEPDRARRLLREVLFRLDVLAVVRMLRGRLVWTVHNLMSHESEDPVADLRSRRFLSRRAGALLVHGNHARASVSSTYGLALDRITVVRHGNYIGAYPGHVSREESRRILGVGPDRFVYLFLGSLRPYKGLEQLVEAYRRLDSPRKLLIVAGTGDSAYLQQIRAQAGSAAADVRLEGRRIPDDELQVFYRAADVVVLPYVRSLTAGSLILAMSFGRMVVAPFVEGVVDYLGPEGGILYNPSEPDALVEALEASPGRDVEAAGRSNLQGARSLDWATAAEETIRLYRSIDRRHAFAAATRA